MRGRLAGSAWRTAWRLGGVGAAGCCLVSCSAARSSSAVSARMRSNSTACVVAVQALAGRAEAPALQACDLEVQRLDPGLLELDLGLHALEQIARLQHRIVRGHVSSVCASEPSSMAAIMPRARARARPGDSPMDKHVRSRPRIGHAQTAVIDCGGDSPRRCHGRPATSQSNCSRVRLSEPVVLARPSGEAAGLQAPRAQPHPRPS